MKKKPKVQASKRERRIQDKKHRAALLQGKIANQVGNDTLNMQRLLEEIRVPGLKKDKGLPPGVVVDEVFMVEGDPTLVTNPLDVGTTIVSRKKHGN